VIPHVTNAIKDFVLAPATTTYDFVLVRDRRHGRRHRGLPFFEAIRQLGNELPRQHAVYIHLTLLPYIPARANSRPSRPSIR
jgi:CTP synthase